MISLIGSGIPTHHTHTPQPLSAKLNPPAIPQLSGFTAYSKLPPYPRLMHDFFRCNDSGLTSSVSKGMILIGHSMGGIVCQLQAVTTGRVIWDAVFKSDADRLYVTLPPDDLIKRAAIFKANTRVKRIVFICMPHRGSYLASNWIGALGVSLIHFLAHFSAKPPPKSWLRSKATPT